MSGPTLSDALLLLRSSSARMAQEHANALRWRESAPYASNVVWLPQGWAAEQGSDQFRHMISQGGIRRIRGIMRSGHAGLHTRGLHILDERCAMQAVVREVLSESAPFPKDCPAGDLFVRYTPLGQPRVGWRGAAAAWARERGIRLRDLHISFTHDGGAVLALASHAPGLKGVGIDVVRLARFRGKTRDYLHRFARHFMSESEYHEFVAESASESDEETAGRVAAHFSLMESASKALGTGLKIGGGMGKPESMPKRSINVRVQGAGYRLQGRKKATRIDFDLASEATFRMCALKASVLEGYVSADSEYLVSAAFLS